MTIENNLLSPLNFSFKLKKAPNVEYLVQQISVPGLNLGTATSPTPFVRLTHPGNITYDDLRITFKAGENLTSYLEIYNWIEGLGRPDSYQQYDYTPTDATLVILNSAKRPIINIQFQDIFPTSLTSLEFDSTMTDVQYMTVDATFSFDRMFYLPQE
jgi:hypothetical protein